MSKKHFVRRRFLQGVGGAVLGLPALDAFQSKARAAAPAKIYSAVLMQQNGSIQGHNGDPQVFWPTKLGAISATDMMGVDAGQATSILVDYASKVIFLRKQDFKYSNNHDGGPVAVTTGSPITGASPKRIPNYESIDVFIASNMTPNVEPLTMYAGRKGTYRDDAMSWAPGGKLRIGDNNPWNIYQRLTGLSGMAQTDPAQLQKIAQRRLSINDVVRSGLRDLMARKELSKADLARLDQHLTSVRELEINMTNTLGPMVDTAALMAVNGTHTTDANMEKVVNLMIDLIAYTFATDRARTATLQIGGCNDHTAYNINGTVAPPYHFISHRVMTDGASGTAIPDAVNLHHEIDKIHARYFKHLLDDLSAIKLPTGGTLLDSSVNLWSNSIADGPPHSGKDVPFILGGGAGGFLKTGLHVSSPGFSNRVLNTMINACGVRKPDGSPVDNFGDPTTSMGMITEIVA
ncbi:MAG TPA: DUF1552 domain-containing protein [Polyangia bacterium]|nr:DUF1552 domain-containing protein [Polyangia bacterium]